MAWEDTDGDGHYELNGEVAPIAAGITAGAGITTGVATTVAGAATLAGPPGVPVAGGAAIVAGGAGTVTAAAGYVTYLADQYDWEYSIEPGQVIEDTGEAIESAIDSLDLEKAGIGRPFTIPLEGASGSFVLGGGQVLGMPRLDAAFARLQGLL